MDSKNFSTSKWLVAPRMRIGSLADDLCDAAGSAIDPDSGQTAEMFHVCSAKAAKFKIRDRTKMRQIAYGK
jgi:hypothetical protein